MSQLFGWANWVDVFTLILLIRITYVSSYLGVGKQILPLLLLVLILVLTLFCSSRMASYLTYMFGFTLSSCKFFSYLSVALVLCVIYRVALHVSNAHRRKDEPPVGNIERVGGSVLGLARSVIIIGLILIGFLLTPVRFVEDSVKSSYAGFFLITANLRVYDFAAKLLFRSDEVTYRTALSELLSTKEKYFFKSPDLKKRSSFFQETDY